MKAGKRDDLITIERNSGTSEDAFGNPTESWTTYATAWAEVVYGSGSERRTTAVEGAEQTATFRVLADTVTKAVTPADRISFEGTWDIHSVTPLDRDGIEFTAVKRAG